MTRLQKWVIGTFVTLYALTSTLSTIHSVDFFRLANPPWLAVSLAVAFEVGAAACLAAIVVLEKTTRWIVWTLFFLVTGVQIVGNMYYTYSHLADYRQWSELFGMVDQDPMLQKRVLSIIAGGILPLVALGFIKSLVEILKPKLPDPPVAEIPLVPDPEVVPEVVPEAVVSEDPDPDRYPAEAEEGPHPEVAPTTKVFGGL